jgi:subtilisin family serine protease
VRVQLALLCLGGCSGGGGSGSGTIGSLPPSSFETEEYSSNYGLGAIHASSAYAAGATGQGVTVAVIDTGIDVDHPEFAGAIHPDSIDIVTDGPTFDDDDGHGTAVAGIIGARRNGALAHGVAYQSRLLIVRADAMGSCAAGCAFAPADVAEATDYTVVHDADVINYSLGGASVLDPTLEDALERAVDAGTILGVVRR